MLKVTRLALRTPLRPPLDSELVTQVWEAYAAAPSFTKWGVTQVWEGLRGSALQLRLEVQQLVHHLDDL